MHPLLAPLTSSGLVYMHHSAEIEQTSRALALSLKNGAFLQARSYVYAESIEREHIDVC
jgi:hypothetical protein